MLKALDTIFESFGLDCEYPSGDDAFMSSGASPSGDNAFMSSGDPQLSVGLWPLQFPSLSFSLPCFVRSIAHLIPQTTTTYVLYCMDLYLDEPRLAFSAT
eukprot:2088720-Ditylum_brightwellii.AAC.1